MKPKILNKSFKKLTENNLDSLFPIIKYGHPIQRALKISSDNKLKYYITENTLTRTQDLKDMFYDAGQFYWMNVNEILEHKKVVTNNSEGILISELEAHDIDNELDWKLAELKFNLLK